VTHQTQPSPIVIPALRAVMGDRAYFVSTLRLDEVSQRISFAEEIHPSKALNELIQRRLNDKRADDIAEYLVREEQRFFNALVVGVYAGNPTWQDFGSITAEEPTDRLHVPAYASETFGFLQLTGAEQLFAIDGQHRLAGIKRAVLKDPGLAAERVAVIFIAHHAGEDGLRRTRRLFTVLNKTARPVLKGDIIALDEDDLMAICTRRLVNCSVYFSRGQVAMRLRNSLPPADQSSWTTITMLYDMLTVLFRDAYPACMGKRRRALASLKNLRATDSELNAHHDFAAEYFAQLANHFAPVRAALSGSNSSEPVPVHRNSTGGHVLYRPLGQKIFTQVAAELCKESPMPDAIGKLALLPTDLKEPPYASVIWNTHKGTMVNTGPAASLCRDLLLHMVGLKPRRSTAALRKDYGAYTGVDPEVVQLPNVVLPKSTSDSPHSHP
jgi:DNA sulfur modification protein DndB